MSKGFDYSKWDKIELSDDEEDLHPNIDKESWFRMKHRSRVEREENEAKEIKKINGEMEKANKRIKVLEHDVIKLDQLKIEEVGSDDDDDDDDDLDDREGLEAELKELKDANATRQARLDEIEKNKKLNVDNMCHVVEERTIINSNAAKTNYTPTGYAKPKEEEEAAAEAAKKKKAEAAVKPAAKKEATKPVVSKPKPAPKPVPTVQPPADVAGGDAMETYHEFTVKYADTVEEFMHIQSLDRTKDFLMKHGNVLLQENASNYLLLASLEDEMNGFHDKMKLTCRQSQICSNVTELAKNMQTHPGNVIIPFFQKLENKEFLEGFMSGVKAFVDKIIKRAVTKKLEMDNSAEEEEEAAEDQPVDLSDIPIEQRLGPGGLDPLEVIETLPQSMQDAFESREIENLKTALMAMDPEDAAYHMKRCVDSGLWVDQGG